MTVNNLNQNWENWIVLNFRDILIVRLPDHMKYMFQRTGEELPNDQLLRVYLLLISRDMVFSRGDTDIGTFTAVKHNIDTGNVKPIKLYN